ncbi:MAG: NRDE family protein [Candidatus Tectimicrobiota bacterium]
MCILMVLHQGIPGYPIVVAANRDEYYERPTEGPHQLVSDAPVWGGKDSRAGGTWLGLNAHGLVIGLTNRRMRADQENDPQRRSRGLLCLEALQCHSADEAAAFVGREPPGRYNPFNLLMMDPQSMLWAAYDDTPQVQRLQPGLHILANGDLNDIETVRIRRAQRLLSATAQTELAVCLPLLEQVCRDHESGVQDRETMCMHRDHERYGTVSSTILAVTPGLRGSIYRYAAGHPCTTPYEDYSLLLTPQP